MTILISGFEPFEGEKLNPSSEAVKRLADSIAGASIVKVEIPTVFGKAIEAMRTHIEREQPDITLCVGQAGGRFDISYEGCRLYQRRT